MKKFVVLLIFLCSSNAQKVDREKLFAALSGESVRLVEAELLKLENIGGESAYVGALLMKKAGFEKGAGNKLRTFKRGAKILESEIEKHPESVEYRFLRLIIQERAPAILKYNKDIEKDKKALIIGYSGIEPELRKIIRNYADGSGVLSKEELK